MSPPLHETFRVIITDVRTLLHSFKCNIAKVVSGYLNTTQIKIIITTFRTTSNPFQHEVCQTNTAQTFS